MCTAVLDTAGGPFTEGNVGTEPIRGIPTNAVQGLKYLAESGTVARIVRRDAFEDSTSSPRPLRRALTLFVDARASSVVAVLVVDAGASLAVLPAEAGLARAFAIDAVAMKIAILL